LELQSEFICIADDFRIRSGDRRLAFRGKSRDRRIAVAAPIEGIRGSLSARKVTIGATGHGLPQQS